MGRLEDNLEAEGSTEGLRVSMAGYDRILTNYTKWRRRIAESLGYGACNEMSENTLHKKMKD